MPAFVQQLVSVQTVCAIRLHLVHELSRLHRVCTSKRMCHRDHCLYCSIDYVVFMLCSIVAARA